MVYDLSWDRLCAWWGITRWRWRSWLILIKRNVKVVIAIPNIVGILIVNIRIVDILVIWILIIGIYMI